MTEEIRKIPPKLTPAVFNAVVDHGLEACASVIIRKTATEFEALNGSTKVIIAHGVDGQTVFEAGCAAASKGSLVFLKCATYPPLTLNHDVSVCGEGMSVTPAATPANDPDAMITGMFGVVIEVTTLDTNGFTLTGTRSNVDLKNIGVKFTGVGTGHGFYHEPGTDVSGLMYSRLDNLFVWGHDKDHYAFWLVNFQHCMLGRLYSFGGPAVHFETDSTVLTYGIADVELIYGRVSPSITSMSKNIIEFIGSSASGMIGGLKIKRLHVMDRSGSNSAAGLYMEHALVINIDEFDCENPGKQMVTLVSCLHIVFQGCFMFGGGITFTLCAYCGFKAGYIDPSFGGVSYDVNLGGGGINYILPTVWLVPNAKPTNFLRTPTDNPSVGEDLSDMLYRVDQQGAMYKEGNFLVLRGHANLTDVADHYCDAMVMKSYSYDHYAWIAKVANPVARTAILVGGFQKHFSWYGEGSILVWIDDGTYYFQTCDESGNTETTTLAGEDWTTAKRFDIIWTATSIELYVDNVLKATHDNYTPMTSGQFFIEVTTKNTPWPTTEPTLYFQLGSLTIF